MKTSFVIAFSVLATLAARSASAQRINLANTAETTDIVEAHTGLDHGFVGELGYVHGFEARERRMFAGVELTMPWAEPDLADYQVRPTFGAVLLGERTRHWRLAAQVGPTIRGSDNVLARLTSVGVGVQITGGWYARRGFIAAELGADVAAVTYIENSDAYRMQIYADAEDGWYRATGGTVRAGLITGLSLGKVDAVLRAGVPRSTDLENQIIPFYVTVGVNVALSTGE